MYAEDPSYPKSRLYDSFDLAHTPKRSSSELPPGAGIFAYRNPNERQRAFMQWLESVDGLGAYDAIRGLGLSWSDVKDAGRWVGRQAKTGYDATIGAAVDYVGEGVNWVVEQVKDFDTWMEDQLEKIGLGGMYRDIADTVVKIGNKALVAVGKTIDGAINIIVVEGGKYVGAIAAGAACAAGNVVGIAIPPHACAAIGAQIGEIAGETIGDVMNHIKAETIDALRPQDVSQGTQQLARGLTMEQCPLPDPSTIVLMFNEPLAKWTAAAKRSYFADLQRRATHPVAKQYYQCRATQYNFGSVMDRLGINSITAMLNRGAPSTRNLNFQRSITALNKIGTQRKAYDKFLTTGGRNVRLSKHATTTPPPEEESNLLLFAASGLAVVGLAVVGKKKGWF